MENVFLFPSYGYILKTLPEDIFNDLTNNVFNPSILNNSASNFLAGNIKEEYWIDTDNLKKQTIDYILETSYEYNDKFHTHKEYSKFDIENIWVNFQKKYEYNPIHDHSGVFSFVIWVKIPYNLEEELKHESAVNANNPTTSMFNFHFTSHMGRISSLSLPVDKNWEGKMILFPANLAHSVNPFYTSDEYRISLAGNIKWTL